MNAIFFVGSMFVAFLNYLYYPVLGRMLPTEAFGELQVAISIFMQIATLLGVFSLVSINILVSSDKETGQRTIDELERIVMYFAILLFGLMVVMSGFLREELKFESVWPIIIIGAMFVVSVPASFRVAYLRAHNDFTGVSISGALGAVVKLLAGIGFVVLGWKAAGAVGGILAAQLASLVYAAIRVRRFGFKKTSQQRKKPDWSLIRPQLKYAAFVLIVSLLVTLQVSIDATVVKYYFTPEQAGLYAGVATVARIVFFIGASTTAVMLSAVSHTQSPSKNIEMLKKSLFLTLLAAGSATVFFCLFPTFTLHLLLGARYDAYAHLLPYLSVAILTCSLASLFGTYLIALHRYAALIPAIVGALISYASIILFHQTVDQIVYGLLVGSATMFAGLLSVIIFRPKTS